MDKPRVLILGKLPPPLMGPALATQIILNSELNNHFRLIHFDTRINASVAHMGKFKLAKIRTIINQYRLFKKALKTHKPHLVLIPISQTTAGFFKDAPFITWSHRAGAKVVVQLRGSAFRSWYDRGSAFRQMGVVRILRQVSGAIVLAQNLRYIFKDLIDESKIYVVPNGGDYTFPEKGKNKIINLTYLANYLPGKGLLEVLKALEILSQIPDLPAFEFHGFGSWDNETYRRQCLEIAKNLPHVHLHNSVQGREKWSAFARADVFVFTPIAPEGHPWSIVEATAAALPVVSTNVGGIAQNVIDGHNGFLIPTLTPQILAQKLETLIRDADLRERMGENSRQLYLEKFTAAAMVQNLENVFHQILNTP